MSSNELLISKFNSIQYTQKDVNLDLNDKIENTRNIFRLREIKLKEEQSDLLERNYILEKRLKDLSPKRAVSPHKRHEQDVNTEKAALLTHEPSFCFSRQRESDGLEGNLEKYIADLESVFNDLKPC